MEFGPYYFVKDLPLYELITHEFINTFVKKGKLILSLDKDTYEETGLQGRPSQYSGRKTMRFIVSIDLMDLSSNLESKKYKRVSWAFREKKPLKFDFLLAWHQTGAEGSMMMSYFSGYGIQEHQPKIALSTRRDLRCPVLRSGRLGGEPEAACSARELFAWLGAVFSHADLRYFDEPKLAPWVTLSVQGFADSPVSWRENEHGFQKGGEHLYNFVIFNNRDYWLQMAVGANDDCPP
ncbi:RPP40, partial [Cervus elaphus hippelaphus]